MTTRRRVLKYLAATATLTAGGVAVMLPRRANAYYAGPPSDHFNGTVFFNPGGGKPKSFRHLAKLQLAENWARWPMALESPYADTPPAEQTGSTTRIVHIGHASWLVQTAGLNILIDPVWSERASPFTFAGPKRVNAPGIAFDKLPRIDVVLVTHNHYDHLDLATLGRLWQRHGPRIVTPLGNDTIMRQEVAELTAETVDWHQVAQLSPSVRVITEPTLHWSARGLRDRRHALWASFVIETPAGRIYAVGDTGFGNGRLFREIGARHGGFDLALLPIGAYEPRWFMRDHHMDPFEAVEAMTLACAKTALGHHWGTFQLTAEPVLQPLDDLEKALAAKGIASERFIAMRPGRVHVMG
jgi:L-ascorbate metabolism protein UlaG (beta-lactamase superfamily)